MPYSLGVATAHWNPTIYLTPHLVSLQLLNEVEQMCPSIRKSQQAQFLFWIAVFIWLHLHERSGMKILPPSQVLQIKCLIVC